TRSLPVITVQLDDKDAHQLVFAGTEISAGSDVSLRVSDVNTILSEIGNITNPVVLAIDPNGDNGERDQAFDLLLQQFSLGCESIDGCPVNNPASSPGRTYDYVFYKPSNDFIFIRSFTAPEEETINQNY